MKIESNITNIRPDSINYIKGLLHYKNTFQDTLTIVIKYKYLVNGGIYILTKKIIKLISKGEEIDMPDLFLKARSKKYNLKVHTLRDYWIDVGRIDKLQLASEKFN